MLKVEQIGITRGEYNDDKFHDPQAGAAMSPILKASRVFLWNENNAEAGQRLQESNWSNWRQRFNVLSIRTSTPGKNWPRGQASRKQGSKWVIKIFRKHHKYCLYVSINNHRFSNFVFLSSPFSSSIMSKAWKGPLYHLCSPEWRKLELNSSFQRIDN